MATTLPGLEAQRAPTRGWCARCQAEHVLPWEAAAVEAVQLAAKLGRDGDLRIAGQGPQRSVGGPSPSAPAPRFSTRALFGEARGKMFGVVVAREPATGRQITLRAFSGQFDGHWEVPGWVGPLFDVSAWDEASQQSEPKIKALTAEIDAMTAQDPRRAGLVRTRRERSQALMVRLHGLYRLHNFRGGALGLGEATLGHALATGVADCCAPKLLNAAAQHGLVPLGLAEFFWGADNLSRTRHHGVFYPACTAKCAPILGHLLCGLPPSLR